RATLADAIGAAGTSVEPAMGRLMDVPDTTPTGARDLKAHPAARAQSTAVDTVRARELVLDRSYFPRVMFQSAFAGRSSGAEIPGQPSFKNDSWLAVPNWAVGLSVTFPAFEFFTVKALKQVELQNELAETARYDQTMQNLTTQASRARAVM